MPYSLIVLCTAFALDVLFGDPLVRLHPIRLVGLLIAKTETLLRCVFPKTPRGELAAGAVLAVFVPAFCVAVFWLLRWGLGRFSPWLALVAESLLCWQLLALRSLKAESTKVYDALQTGSLENARHAVSMIVGRDTQNLDHAGVTKAAVETIAENTSDGVIAPLLFIAIGGAPLGLLYKAVNTMDSMVGYKNPRYLYFGRAAAKLDDLLNYLPARFSALCMILGAGLVGQDAKNALYIFKRDRTNHASPNSAQTEAVCAGALGVQLAGDAIYGGRLVEKPTIGDALRPIESYDIPRANKLLYAASFLCFAACAGARLLIFLAIGG